MKKMITFVLLFLILAVQVHAQAFTSPDVLIDTKLDADWSGILVTKIRRLMKNLNKPDPFRQKFIDPIIVSEAKVNDYMTPETRELLSELGKMLEMDILNAKTQVTIHGLRYNIRGFKTELSATENKVEGLSIGSDFSASKIMVTADKVTLALIMPGKNALPVINIEVTKPLLMAAEDKLINFFAKIQIKNNKDAFNLFLEEADFSRMAEGLIQRQDVVVLDFESIIVPKVSIRIGNKEIKFDPKKIEALVNSKRAGIKGLLVAEVSSLLINGTGEDLLKSLDKVVIPKNHWIDSDSIFSQLKIDSFENEENGHIVEVKMSGDFCPHDLYLAQGERCLDNKISRPIKSRITQENHKDSLDTMRNAIHDGEANIIVSISEDYVNKALIATYDTGLGNSLLKEAGLMMGPNKVFIRMDEKDSNTGTLYMDMLYTPKKIERMAIGAKQVRFPLVIKVGLKIRQENKVPIFVINMAGVDTSDETLLNGKPEIGVVSNIHTLRMKKKILGALRKETESLANKDILELRYPELRGLDLDKVDFVSDGAGRMNALILLKDNVAGSEE